MVILILKFKSADSKRPTPVKAENKVNVFLLKILEKMSLQKDQSIRIICFIPSR